MKKFLLFTLLVVAIAGSNTLYGQQYFTVSGTVVDSRTLRPLDYVNVSVEGTNAGTITNSEGCFNLKIDNRFADRSIEVSRIGYLTKSIKRTPNSNLELRIDLASFSFMVDPVTVNSFEPRRIIEMALERVPDNYDNSTCRITGFYREVLNKRSKCINIAEAVIDIYKSAYTNSSAIDRVSVVKGRSLVSGRERDTISVKMQGGPNLPRDIDVIRQRESFFENERLDSYIFTVEQTATIDSREQLVIGFKPASPSKEYVQYFGRLFIDSQTLAFTRIEYALDMTYPEVVTNAILIRKPAGLRFKPVEVSNVITYTPHEGRYRFNYLLTSVSFKCDWRRRLFSTSYSIVSECVATDSSCDNVEMIAHRQAFRNSQSLSDRIGDFEDADFWGAYNIIEPTESLEHAIVRLKKTVSE